MRKAIFAIALLVTLAVTNSSCADRHAHVEFLNTDSVFPKGLPFSEGVRVGDMIFLSGQIGVTPGTLTLVEGGIQAEAKQTMENIGMSLEANGLSLGDLVKCTIVMADISEWSEFNAVYESYFEEPFPARSAFGTNGLAVGARVEVECIAVVSD